jgi:hypothetical protein
MKLHLGRRGQVDPHLVAHILAGNQSGRSRKMDPLRMGPAQRMNKTGKASRAIAAHLGFAAVGIIIAHPEIGVRLIGWLDGEQPVGTDAEMAIAKPGDLVSA